jgi:hypothetical protein
MGEENTGDMSSLRAIVETVISETRENQKESILKALDSLPITVVNERTYVDLEEVISIIIDGTGVMT